MFLRLFHRKFIIVTELRYGSMHRYDMDVLCKREIRIGRDMKLQMHLEIAGAGFEPATFGL